LLRKPLTGSMSAGAVDLAHAAGHDEAQREESGTALRRRGSSA